MKAEPRCSECEELQSAPHAFNCQVFAGRVAQPAESRIVDPVGAGSTPVAPATPDTEEHRRAHGHWSAIYKEIGAMQRNRKVLVTDDIPKPQFRDLTFFTELKELLVEAQAPKAIVVTVPGGGLMTYMELMEELGVEDPPFKDARFASSLPLHPQDESMIRRKNRRYVTWIDKGGDLCWFQFKSGLQAVVGMERIQEIRRGATPIFGEVVGGWDLSVMASRIRGARQISPIAITAEEQEEDEKRLTS